MLHEQLLVLSPDSSLKEKQTSWRGLGGGVVGIICLRDCKNVLQRLLGKSPPLRVLYPGKLRILTRSQALFPFPGGMVERISEWARPESLLADSCFSARNFRVTL